MADNYYRLLTLQTDIATPVLRDLLQDCAKKDTSTGEIFTTLQRYLFLKEPVIGHLFHNEKWKYNKIYPSGKPSSSSVVSDGGTFDVSMLTSLLLGLFKNGKTPVLSSATAIDVKYIKDVRNSDSVAHGFSTNISLQDFENTWKGIETAILSIACLKGNAAYLDEVNTHINTTLLSKLPGMWNSCAKWFTSVIEEQMDTIRYLKTVVDTGTEMQRHPSGRDQKRFKTVNEKHKTLKLNFKTLMANSSHDDIALSTATAEIRQTLTRKKRVIVTGESDSQYESVALAAIKELPDYDVDFCVAINDPQEWRDMDEELVKVVVFKDPFGSEDCNRIQCNTMLEIFERIEKSKTRNMPVATVILSQKQILDYSFSFVNDHAHAFFGDICEPCKAGSDYSCPIDLEVEKRVSLRKKYQPRSQAMKNMLDMSSVYLEGLQKIGVQDTKFEFGELEKYGCLVVTGEEPSDVTSFVAKLATREKGKNTVVLQCPSDIRHVEINVTDTLIIDFFAGQYELELGKAKLWIDKFDLLYSLSQKLKLCIIVSSTRPVLDALKESLPRNQPVHSLLSRVVDITKNNVPQVMKLEPDAQDLDAQVVTSAVTMFGKMNNKTVRAIETSTLMTINQTISGPPPVLGCPRVSYAPNKLQNRKNKHQWYSDSYRGPPHKRSRIHKLHF
ncbi:hypothetical protein MAR_033672 [Mya arenaria]|uniref:Uncharacterized protein n=1 Tax=Mya arenaria TaxID=6604 RepID=A0ABY7G9P5_MYAAR|nr:uncharacterized protein LOC128224613 [Mya arenaria]XP_052790499.1 uncharacterized protein LOC128224613 [Mya arenaria]WAR31130.1 hypothetical protein MAR_033672 [Mya arenaria]